MELNSIIIDGRTKCKQYLSSQNYKYWEAESTTKNGTNAILLNLIQCWLYIGHDGYHSILWNCSLYNFVDNFNYFQLFSTQYFNHNVCFNSTFQPQLINSTNQPPYFNCQLVTIHIAVIVVSCFIITTWFGGVHNQIMNLATDDQNC